MAENNWKSFSFLVPIKESVTENSQSPQMGTDFLIEGVAINATTTMNGHKFMAEELEKSAHTLRNKPLLKDHNNSVDSIVGKTTDKVFFDAQNHNVVFQAKVVDETCKKKIKDGLISSVSVGASCDDIVESDVAGEEGVMVVKGINFLELSLVAVPADPNAGFAMAVSESVKLKKQSEECRMEETPKIVPAPVQEATSPVVPEVKEADKELLSLKEEILALKKLVESKKENEDKTKGIVGSKAEDFFAGLVVERADGNKVCIYSQEYDRKYAAYAR